jgi:hypothetical protein
MNYQIRCFSMQINATQRQNLKERFIAGINATVE